MKDLLESEVEKVIRNAMLNSWLLGQTYWRQADSESIKQHINSDKTRDEFIQLIEDTIVKIKEINNNGNTD